MKKNVSKKRLNLIDRFIYKLLKKNVDNMPVRLCKLIANYYTDARIRKLYWNRLGVVMGEGTFSNLGLSVTNDTEHPVIIGDRVSIGPNLTLIAVSCANNGIEINELAYVRDTLTKSASIIIEDEVWIGANVVILPGVHIGRCCVVGAGSVVNHDTEPYSVYVGVPARKIRDLKTGERTGKKEQNS